MALTETWFRPHPFWHRDRWRSLLMVLVINCAIAVVVTFTDPYNTRNLLLVTNAAGFTIWGLGSTTSWLSRGRLFPWHLPVTIPLGLYLGLKFAALLGEDDIVAIIANDHDGGWKTLLVIAVLAIAGSSMSIFYVRLMATRSALSAERRRASESKQAETSAKLALLQAQIEPHFLFNTLANAQSLIERDPALAKETLEHLNHYLRVSLVRTRKPVANLSEELDLVRTLLAIAAIRLGPRLRYSVTADQDLDGVPLPPLLLQPLVENALRHGIEPSVQGGEIHVHCTRRDGMLHLRVEDSGVGMLPTAADGVGLSNVRARLSNLYGERARLALYANRPSGVIAELAIPLAAG